MGVLDILCNILMPNINISIGTNAELIVSVLSLLVTVLLGMQFYSAIEVRKSINNYRILVGEQNGKISDIKQDVDGNEIYTRASLVFVQGLIIMLDLINKKEIRDVEHIMKCHDTLFGALELFYQSRKSNADERMAAAKNCTDILKYLNDKRLDINVDDANKNIPILKEHRRNIQQYLKGCNNLNEEIDNIEEIMNNVIKKLEEIKKAASQGDGPGH